MTRKLILAAALAASVLSGGVAFAAPPSAPADGPGGYAASPPPPPRAGRGPMRADANGDQIVTRQEAMADATRRFDRMDRNRDGKLEAAEMTPRRDRGPGARAPRGDMPPPPPPPYGE